MKPQTTRTLNPLPFQDLEPHRFEDLIRGLAYGFREWKSLEAIGRSGSDEGIDIRGIEMDGNSDTEEITKEDEESIPATTEERIWIFQCKREKSISPARIDSVVTESLRSMPNAPYGFVLAASCDLSKKAREKFRESMVARGIKEFFVWSRGELEDMLFQAANDRLLFAFFNISLQQKRRSLATSLRHDIAVKKKLEGLFKKSEGSLGRLMLIRDPSDTRYPLAEPNRAGKSKWILCQYQDMDHPLGMKVVTSEHFAWITEDGKSWDYIEEVDIALSRNADRIRHESILSEKYLPKTEEKFRQFWEEYAPEERRAIFKFMNVIPYSRIIAVDSIGDGCFPMPHIYVEWSNDGCGPFADGEWAQLEGVGARSRITVRPNKKTRISIFPKKIPTKVHTPLPSMDRLVGEQTVSAAGLVALKITLSSIAEQAKPLPQNTPRPSTTDTLRYNAFHTWRDEVAAPTLTALMKELRKAGHDARIQIEDGSPEKPEYIELRVRVNKGDSFANSDYRPSGHIRFSCTWHCQLEVKRLPNEDESRRYSESTSDAVLEEYNAERIEMEVTKLVEAVAKQH